MHRNPFLPNSTLVLFHVLLAVLLSSSSCNRSPEPLFAAGGTIRKLAEPVQLETDTTYIDLTTYFIPRSLAMIDSVTGCDRLVFLYPENSTRLKVVPRSLFIPHLSEMKVWISGVPYSFLLQRPLFERFDFSFDPRGQRYGRVSITGEMNGWNPRSTPLHLIDGVWQATLALEPGTYLYRIVADGREMPDPNNPLTNKDSKGEAASVLVVGKANPASVPVFSGYRYRRGTLVVELENQVDEVFVFWQNFRLPADQVEMDGDRIYVGIPDDALNYRESVLRFRAHNEHGPSGGFTIRLERGIPVSD